MCQKSRSINKLRFQTIQIDYNMKRTENLRPHQEELLQLSELAGIHADPSILKIMIELLNMKVPPHALYSMIKSIRYSTIEQEKIHSKLSTKHDSQES